MNIYSLLLEIQNQIIGVRFDKTIHLPQQKSFHLAVAQSVIVILLIERIHTNYG